MSKSSPTIFISHSTKDNDFVKRLADDLCHVLKDDDAVWYDILALAGTAWWDVIVKQLVTRKKFILILSPDSLRSPWVHDEIRLAWRRKNLRNKAKKDIIIVHFRESMNKIPKELDYLVDSQWVQFIAPETYQSGFIKLLGALGVPMDTYVNEFLRKLNVLDSSYERPMTPKAVEDFSDKEKEESLKSLGKYAAVYVSKGRWDSVIKCAEEALSLDPDNSEWIKIQQEADERLTQIRTAASYDFNNVPNLNSTSKNTDEKVDFTQSQKFSDSEKETEKDTNLADPIRSKVVDDSTAFSSLPNGRIRNRRQRANVYKTSSEYRDYGKKTLNGSKSYLYQGFTQSLPSNRKENVLLDGLGKIINFSFRSKKLSPKFVVAFSLCDILLLPSIFGLGFYKYFPWVFFPVLLLVILIITSNLVINNTRILFTSIVGLSALWCLACWYIGLNSDILISAITKSVYIDRYNLMSVLLSSIGLLAAIYIHSVIVFKTNFFIKRKSKKR